MQHNAWNIRELPQDLIPSLVSYRLLSSKFVLQMRQNRVTELTTHTCFVLLIQGYPTLRPTEMHSCSKRIPLPPDPSPRLARLVRRWWTMNTPPILAL